MVDLSVLMPTYNYGGFIAEALRSVLAQAPANVEIVVADDGSTDDTAAVVRALDPRVRYFRQDNAGPAAARNLALREARGRYLMFLDADDSLVEGCIARTIAFLDAHPEVGLFFTNYDIYDENGIVSPSGVDIWKRFRGLPHREVDGDGWIFTESLTPHIVEGGAFMHTSGLTIRREVYEEIGPFLVGYAYGEDDEFYARAAWVTTAGYVDRVLSRKRNHAGSIIHDPANALRNAEHILRLSEHQLGYYDDPRMQEILRAKVLDCAQGWIWRLIRAGRKKEARAALAKYRARYPGSRGLIRLWLRSLFPV